MGGLDVAADVAERVGVVERGIEHRALVGALVAVELVFLGRRSMPAAIAMLPPGRWKKPSSPETEASSSVTMDSPP